MSRVQCIIKAACVTQDYFLEYGSIIITCPNISLVIKRVPSTSEEFEKLISRINKLVLNYSMDEVDLIFELDEYSQDYLKKFPIKNYIDKIQSPIPWNIQCKHFTDDFYASTTFIYYEPADY